MFISMRVSSLTCGVCLLLLMLSSMLSAQFAWPRTADGSCIKIEYLAPSLAQNSSFMSVTGYTMSLSGHFRVGEGTFIAAEIPYTSTTVKYSNPYYGGTQSTTKSSIGNIYMGLEFVGEDPTIFGELGMRLPTISKDNMEASILGILGDANRWEVYVAELLAVQGAVNYHPVYESGVGLLFRIGPSVWIPTKGSGGNDTEVFIDYGAGVGFENETFRIGGGISGRAIVTEETFFFDKRAVHHVEFGTNVRIAQFRPGVFIRIPLEKEVSDVISQTLGISLSYVFE
jgi:hypothetical protein